MTHSKSPVPNNRYPIPETRNPIPDTFSYFCTMNLRKHIPEFFIRPRNTVIQIIFTALFAYAFILIYHPFGSQEWFEVNQGQFAFYAGFVVVLGMLVVIISRVIMSQIRKRLTITIAGYSLMTALEVLAMTGFYMMIQKVFLKDDRFWFEVYYTAIENTSLILLIPYLISILYFAWQDKKQNLDQLLRQKENGDKPRFIPFADENGEVRITLNLADLLYIEANENYVLIHFVENDKPERFLLRNSMKGVEGQLALFPVVRCHRSYLVNTLRIKVAKKDKSGLIIQLHAPTSIQLPVSATFKDKIINALAT